MRVAVFASQFPARPAYLSRDLRALADAGADLEVFAVRPGGAAAPASGERESQGAATVHQLTLRDGARRAAWLVRRRAAACLRDGGALLAAASRAGLGSLARTAYLLPKAWAWAAGDSDRFDRVLAYRGGYVGTCAYAFHRLLPRRVPFTLWIHGGVDLRHGSASLRRKLLHADTVLTCCAENRESLARRWPGLWDAIAARVHVCHHGLDLARLPYQPESRNPRHVVAVGPLRRGRGLEALLRAAFLLRVRGVDLTVELVGDGPHRERLRRLAATLGLSDRVRFRRRVTPELVGSALREATLAVYPSPDRHEGIPPVVCEAMARGTPVVASRAGAVPEALDGGCGLLVPPDDEASLADAIATLLADPGLRRRTVARARMRAEGRFDAGKNGERLAELLWGASSRGQAGEAARC
jgi:glycosyltransferase involved in cell wall biosynthesis